MKKILILSFLLFTLFAGSASADVIQPDFSTAYYEAMQTHYYSYEYCTDTANCVRTQGITGLSGTLAGASVYGSGDGQTRFYISTTQCDDAAMTINCAEKGWVASIFASGSVGIQSASANNYASSLVFDPAKYYGFAITNVQYYGGSHMGTLYGDALGNPFIALDGVVYSHIDTNPVITHVPPSAAQEYPIQMSAYNSYCNANQHNDYCYSTGTHTGLTGIPGRVYTYGRGDGKTRFVVRMTQCDDIAGTVNCVEKGSIDMFIGGAFRDYSGTLAGTISPLDPTKYYYFSIANVQYYSYTHDGVFYGDSLMRPYIWVDGVTKKGGNFGTVTFASSTDAVSPPTITLNGNATGSTGSPQATTIEYGAQYTDAGATANDQTDGDITNKIVKSGEVDTTKLGTTTITYTVTNSKSLTATTTRDVVVQCTINCYDNVMFLPGIEASRMYYPTLDPISYTKHDNKVWEPAFSSDAQELRMNADGSSARTDLYTKDTISTAYLPGIGNVYKDFLAQMQSWQTKYSITATTTPYDWRLDYDTILANGKKLSDGSISYLRAPEAGHNGYIQETLENLAAHSKTGKVTIIAHSMGGLVAKALMQKIGSASTTAMVGKAILVASPQAGTPEAFGALLHGQKQGLPSELFDVALSKQAARELANNMPSTYALLPSADYFTYVDDPVATFDHATLQNWITKYGVDNIHSQDRQHAFLTDTAERVASTSADLKTPALLNASLVTQAEQLHAKLDSWVPPQGVQVIQIAGWGIPSTIKGTEYASTSKNYFCNGLSGQYCEHGIEGTATTTLDGDGTVVVPSALWVSKKASGVRDYWVNLGKINDDEWFTHIPIVGGFLGYSHASIFQVDPLRAFIEDQFVNLTKPFSVYGDYITSTRLVPTEKRLRYELHSPLTLDLYDANGHHTGIATSTGKVEMQVPGAYYMEYLGVKYLFTDASSTAHIVMNGYATSTFTFKVEELQGDTPVTQTTFKDIPVTPTTKVKIDTTSDLAHLAPMQIDKNGDGKTDMTLAPKLGDVVTMPPADTNPPEVQITFSTSTKAIQIIGQDAEGATTQKTTSLYKQECIQYKRDKWFRETQECVKYKQTKTGDFTIVTDGGRNTLSLLTDPQETRNTALHFTALRYSTSIATTTVDATIRYNYSTDRRGNITMLSAIIRTPTLRTFSIYNSRTNETVIYETQLDTRKYKDDTDDDDDEVHSESIFSLFDRYPRNHRSTTVKKVKGMVIPNVQTNSGKIISKY